MKKRVLVYPCGTEIGLEIYKSLKYSTHYEVWGGSSTYDHGRFVYERHIDDLPFIDDNSDENLVAQFNSVILQYGIDIIYPAMDGVVSIFAKYRQYLSAVVIAPDYSVAQITRSKSATYNLLKNSVEIPRLYENVYEVEEFPCFMKPDVGQGSKGAQLVSSPIQLQGVRFGAGQMLVMENLPGEEYTVDCFTNNMGEIVYSRARKRRRIKGGISVNAVFVDRPELKDIAEKINIVLPQLGGWFFQVKEDKNGTLKLLEVASRVAGASAITRAIGVNLPLLTVNAFMGINTDQVIVNDCYIELDRALENRYITDIEYDSAYVDFDDTLIVDGVVNLTMIKLIYLCVNEGKKVILLSRHTGTSLEKELEIHHMSGLFDEVIKLTRLDKKSDYISTEKPIFIDDSYGERKEVYDALKIPVFDTHTVECLLK